MACSRSVEQMCITVSNIIKIGQLLCSCLWFSLCDAMLAWYMPSSCICEFVCHTLALYQNG